MNVLDPNTWTNLDNHPVIQELGDENWRENFRGEVGDSPDTALKVVQQAVLELRSLFPAATTELVVLDNLSWHVVVESDKLEGEIAFCDDQTVCLRLDMDNQESLYEDDIQIGKVVETIKKHIEVRSNAE